MTQAQFKQKLLSVGRVTTDGRTYTIEQLPKGTWAATLESDNANGFNRGLPTRGAAVDVCMTWAYGEENL